MTTLFMDGFDHYGGSSAKMLDGVWANVGGALGAPPVGARTGTYALGNVSTNVSTNRLVLPATKSHLFISLGYFSQGLPLVDAKMQIINFNTAANAIIAYLTLESNGAISLRNSGGTVLVATQGPAIVSDNWHFLEMEINRSTGAFVLRIDDANASGTPAINASGLSLGSTDIGQLEINIFGSSITGSSGTYVDDLFIRDASGTVNNSWLGDRRIATLLVDADTTTAGWTANRYTKLGAGILNLTTSGAGVAAATATSLNIGNSDFTLEGFVRFQSLPTASNKAVIFSRWGQGANQRSYQLFLGSQALNGGSLCWQTSTDGTGSTITQSIIYPWTPDLDTWYHIAMVRASGQLLLFVDGQQYGLPIADSTTYFAGTAPFGLGAEYNSTTSGIIANTSFDGWMDEVRFTNGYARYTANFTPPVVEFTRGAGDPQWANVALLCGFNTLIQDESSFARALTATLATQKTPNDGASIGVWPVIGKAGPDDDSFIEAPFVPATSILTLTVNPSDGNTVTVGTTNGTTPAVYRFKTALAAAFDVLIDTTIANTLQNLYNAINLGPGSGTKYHASTTVNNDVNASQLPAGQMKVIANVPGTSGNSIATSSSGITGSWTSTTLAGGLNIPGPSNFKVQRLPLNTTLISAVQIASRSYKSDSGIGTFHTALVGPLGGVLAGTTRGLTVSPIYYNDIFEHDPDTSGPISPTTITGGAIQINRDT